jgi:hypothetical protein
MTMTYISASTSFADEIFKVVEINYEGFLEQLPHFAVYRENTLPQPRPLNNMDSPWRSKLYTSSSACEIAPYEPLEAGVRLSSIHCYFP